MHHATKTQLTVGSIFRKTLKSSLHYFWDIWGITLWIIVTGLPLLLIMVPFLFIKSSAGIAAYTNVAIALGVIGGIAYVSFASITSIKFFILCSQEKEEPYLETIKWGLGKMGSNLMLFLRTFFYTFTWLLILIMIGYSLSTVLIEEGAVLLPSVLFLIALIGVGALILTRSIRAYFSMASLAEKDSDSKAALMDSIEMVKNRWWKTFGYTLLFVFLPNFIYQILLGVLNFIAENNAWKAWTDGAMSLLFIIPISFFLGIFAYFFIVYMYYALEQSKH